MATLLVLLAASSWLAASLAAAVDGDPAPGRSPGPPGPPGLPALSVADQEDHHQLTVDMRPDTDSINKNSGEDKSSCDLHGDLIVVDAEKVPVNVSFSHQLFETNVLSLGIVYQGIVYIFKCLLSMYIIEYFTLN